MEEMTYLVNIYRSILSELEPEDRCGAPVLTDVPPDGDSDDVTDDVTIDFSDEAMLPVFYVMANPVRGSVSQGHRGQ